MSVLQKNMQKRRERILGAARAIISREGVDALTTRHLAEAAGVTVPTLYNLIGSKEQILHMLGREGAVRMKLMLEDFCAVSALEGIELLMDRVTDMLRQDPDYFRALYAYMSDKFAPQTAAAGHEETAATIAMSIVLELCEAGIETGELRGNLPADELAEQMFYAYRGAIQDWVFEDIGLDEAGLRANRGCMMILASDAADPVRAAALARIKKLAKETAGTRARAPSRKAAG